MSSPSRVPVVLFLFATFLSLAACGPGAPASSPTQPEAPPGPTAADAAAFVQDAESRLEKLYQYAERMSWVQSTYITDDTVELSALATEALTAGRVEAAADAVRYLQVDGLDEVTRRKLNLLRSDITVPAPLDADNNAEQARIVARLEAMYGSGSYCNEDGDCKSLEDLEEVMDHSRDPAALLDAWNGWRTVSPPMEPLFAREMELANQGARELGFDDLGAMWRSGYDMPASEFPTELDRLWGQVRPLYEALHCHVRARLNAYYGDDVVPAQGPIPAHVLGNMWAQTWDNIYDLVGPGESNQGYDLTEILRNQKFDPIGMVKTGEGFYSSLGLEPMPGTFWARSMFSKPRDRDVVCHPSAWDIDEKDDLRIKMCIEINDEDFKTVHHELGHDYYYRAYQNQSFLHRKGAHDGFHEAIGDTLSLSITPAYLVQIGLLSEEPDASADLGLLMKRALEKVAFLPFGLMVDQWRWKVFAGEVGPQGYNDLWWQLREQYQGVATPNDRPADAFDPGAKFHIPGNVPYTRYFLADILQFQFFKALCEISGYDGPVHRCSFYASEEAGRRLNAMLEMGRSEPWPDALEALTGNRQMDGTAVLGYFAPLKEWLDEQNAGRQCGW